jgi:glycine/D-amino acid oxidase-like deaminating enzyme
MASDVIVIGSGIAGASTAFHLADAGVGVTLIEKEHPASGPTGKSSAVSHLFYTEPELSRLAQRGCAWLKRLPEIGGGPAVFHETGMMWCTGKANAEVWAAAARRIHDEEGGELFAIAPEELAARAPDFIMEDIAIGIWEPAYGYADPYEATNGFVEAARTRGATVRQQARVGAIETAGGRVAGVRLDSGETLAADIVIAATGPWTKALVAPLGVDLPLHIERHAMAVLDAPGQARSILPFAWCDDILAYYARPEREDSILIGTWAGGGTGIRNVEAGRPHEHADPNEYNADSDQDEAVWIIQQMLPRVPRIAELGIRPGYACLYDMSPDDLPVIDQIPGTEGLFVVAGSSGHGFKLGPAVGEEVARLATTGRSDLLAPFSLSRFE